MVAFFCIFFVDLKLDLQEMSFQKRVSAFNAIVSWIFVVIAAVLFPVGYVLLGYPTSPHVLLAIVVGIIAGFAPLLFAPFCRRRYCPCPSDTHS